MMDERILRYAYENRSPQGLKIVLEESGMSERISSDFLDSNLPSFGGYKGKQYNYLTGTYQTLPEWLSWFKKNRDKIKIRS